MKIQEMTTAGLRELIRIIQIPTPTNEITEEEKQLMEEATKELHSRGEILNHS